MAWCLLGVKPLPESMLIYSQLNLNTLRPRQNGRHFADTISSAFSWVKMLEFRLRFHWSFVPKVQINNIPAMVQIMAWRRPGDKPLSKPMMVSLLTHICVTRPQWVKECISIKFYFKFKSFHLRKCILQCHLQNGGHLVWASLLNLLCWADILQDKTPHVSHGTHADAVYRKKNKT